MKIEKIELNGELGKALRLSCEKRLKPLNYALMVEPYRKRNEVDNAWRCEFWGKVTRSAVLTAYDLQDSELMATIKKTVYDMMSTQTADGCVSTYPYDRQLGHGWEVWGRKYVLLTMVRYYELIDRDPAVRDFCVRVLDNLMKQLAEKNLRVLDTGEVDGLASSSILDAVVGVYRISGEKRFLDFARTIVEQGCSRRHNIYKATLEGTIPSQISGGKAYEMTSCFQGLADFNAQEPKDEYAKSCLHYFEDVRDREIFITGIAGNKDVVGEFWNDGAFNQTRGDRGGMGETCVTVTWLHYLDKIAELTDSTSCIDEAERSLYNGILGAMAPDGEHWTHCNPTPLTGGAQKKPSGDQIGSIFHTPFDGHDCCRAQGPEGIAMATRFAAAVDRNGKIRLNLLEAMNVKLDNGITLTVSGNYPAGNTAKISLLNAKGEIPLMVRIPKFCTGVELNGNALDFTPGAYLEINRAWCNSDTLTLTFDLTPKKIAAPDGSAFFAVMRGPLVMAEDSRGTAIKGKFATIDFAGKHLIDYATAGDAFSPDNTLTVWFAEE